MESLANRHRPRQFSEVVGQENTITILTNQIQTEEIKHGYLFTGGAGTGKTTIARIFAREINRQPIDEEEGIDVVLGEIIEIDAASNNGVDHVREIRENSKFKPIAGGYKVYVIDECHMLSTGAWNALLKTLEEPPAHVVFLLCTTDPQKIPATILSRVQRFQFKRMTTRQIEMQLDHIAVVEDLSVSEEAIEYIARLANGGMRDAISLLDTCVSFSQDPEEELKLEDVVNIVGTTNYIEYIKLILEILDKDGEHIIETIERIHNDGKDLRHFMKGFMEFILDIEKYNTVGNFDYLTIPSTFKSDMDKLIRYNLFDKWFDRLAKLNEWIKFDSNPKVLIEGCLLALTK
jgi:DNA polymerase-3 subunit gamma/tau